MSDRPTDELERWLAAEQAEAIDEADALFAVVARRHLPLLQEPAGLAAAILSSLPRTKRSRWTLAILSVGVRGGRVRPWRPQSRCWASRWRRCRSAS